MFAFELDEGQKALKQMASDFAKNEIAPIAAELDKRGEFSWDLHKKMAALGFAGMTIPEEYGGSNLSFLDQAIVMEELSRVDAGPILSLAPHNCTALVIVTRGTKQQKEKYLRRLANGEWLAAGANTEPNAGSDIAALETRAVLDGDYYVVNGTKCFITNGGEAQVYGTLVKTQPEKGAKGISYLLIEKGTPGFTFGRHDDKLGSRASTSCQLFFEDCRVPKENLIGAEGEGFASFQETMNQARVIASGALALGSAEGALDVATEYAKTRIQFGRPIGAFQGVQFMLADMAMQVEAAKLLLYQAAYLIDHYPPRSIVKQCCIAKCYASDIAMKVTIDAIQILGGYGYIKEYPVERYMRNTKIHQIIDGTNQIQRMLIARELLGKLPSK